MASPPGSTRAYGSASWAVTGTASPRCFACSPGPRSRPRQAAEHDAQGTRESAPRGIRPHAAWAAASQATKIAACRLQHPCRYPSARSRRPSRPVTRSMHDWSWGRGHAPVPSREHALRKPVSWSWMATDGDPSCVALRRTGERVGRGQREQGGAHGFPLSLSQLTGLESRLELRQELPARNGRLQDTRHRLLPGRLDPLDDDLRRNGSVRCRATLLVCRSTAPLRTPSARSTAPTLTGCNWRTAARTHAPRGRRDWWRTRLLGRRLGETALACSGTRSDLCVT